MAYLLPNLASEETSSRSVFFLKYNMMTKAVVYMMQAATFLYFRSNAMFYLPQGWVGPFSYLLSMPFAPSGSVSVVYWFMACQYVLNLIIPL